MKIMRSSIATTLCLLVCGTIAIAQDLETPFSVTEAPFASPAMDGDISDWMAMRNDTNVLNFSFAHGAREGTQVGEPLEVNIQYAWDTDNFYFLVEEMSDDDPSSDLNDLDWCQECFGSSPGPAPWSTDSVGFYDQGITWPADGMPGDLAPLSTDIKEKGPYTQFWVGLPTAEDIEIDGDAQNFHLVRSLDLGAGEGNSARLVGNRSEENIHEPMIPDKQELTTVQSAHGIIDDGANEGRGRRFTEAYMRWDQIRYPDPEKNPDLSDTDQGAAIVDRLDALNFPEDTVLELDQMVGHYVEDIAEGYEFRLDPLLVDGLGEPVDGAYPFGGQTHPSGKEHPNTGHVMEWNEASVIRLTAAAEVSVPGDCSGDGRLGSDDLSCVTTIADRDLVLASWNSLPGDLDGNGSIDFPDFLILSSNFGNEPATYAEGNIDLVDGVTFADFLVFSANFGGNAGASPVPEPSTLALLGIGGLVVSLVRRKRTS